MEVHFLSELPLNAAVRVAGDTGKPIVLEEAGDGPGAGFLELARRTVARVAETAGIAGPTIEVED